ncbi:hypothetical protein [Corallococcus sp. EGB]|uniref:hypothetical protein n=1 Tax=Corallococcus sp. EGB TaxID=1521117 RepID=UPI001CBC7AAE|nr:hypothetical protein [Corallococcus sp. EGB]
MHLRALALTCFTALAACDNAPVDNTLPASTEEVGVNTAAATATRISAAIGDNDLSFETLGTFEQRDGVRALILRATANRYLADVLSFVPDDAFGDAHIISERRFEIVLHEGYELNTVLSGLPLFIRVTTNTGTPRAYTARIVVAPRFYDFRGDSGIWIDEEVTPRYVIQGNDNLIYRGHATAAGRVDWLSVTAPDGIPSVYGRPNFKLDWTYTKLHEAIDPHTVPLAFSAGGDDGPTMQKTARLVARVTELALTDGDAYDVWPSPPCDPVVSACYHSQPAGTTDFGQCGTYRQVLSCTY